MSIKNLSLRRTHHRISTRREKWSKLSEADLDAVAAAYARGDRVSDIAEKFGISHSTPADIARRKGIPLRCVREKPYMPVRSIDISQVDAEREDRMHGYAARDLTATMMGDPPVGFSALDRRG